MTVATAIATSYVAVATYQDQKDKEEQKAESEARDFAERVEFTITAEGVAIIDNPNRFPLSRVTLSSFVSSDGLYYKIEAEMRPTLVPACTRLSVRFDKVFSGELGKSTLGGSTPMFGNAEARFQDRNGDTWAADGSSAFARLSNGESYAGPTYRYGSDTGAEIRQVSFGGTREVAVRDNSPRCK
ncbi:hypothetical protein HLK59_16155 [Streptomyces sp. S3(2020)]|nr:hypothetical protein [Streptomyces sp. S3(2020)]